MPSRAVLVGAWDYQYLPPVPAARNSLERMRALLTGELCGWDADQVAVIGNRATPGDLHDQLVELYSDTDAAEVALFYFVGHGQPDDQDRLCLGLTGSRTDFHRRASTSLRFDDVRHALVGCAAETKIVMLDCCFAGLAARSQQSLSGSEVLDMVRTGAYTMAASGAYLPAWFETDSPRPQTYFTRYFADVVEQGLPGQSAGLTLDRIFAETAANLVRDNKPEPTHTARHEAGRMVFARNAAPVEQQVDTTALIADLEAKLHAVEAEVAELRAKDIETDQRLRESPGKGPLEVEATRSTSRLVAAEVRRAETADALRELTPDVAVPETPGANLTVKALAAAVTSANWSGTTNERYAMVTGAADRPIDEVVEFVGLLEKARYSTYVHDVVRRAAQRPVPDIIALVAALPGHLTGRLLRAAVAARSTAENVELLTGIGGLPDAIDVALAKRMVLEALGEAFPARRVTEMVDVLRERQLESEVRAVLRMAGRRQDSGLVLLCQEWARARRTDDLVALLAATRDRTWRTRRALRAAVKTTLPEDVWRPLLRPLTMKERWQRPFDAPGKHRFTGKAAVRYWLYSPLYFAIGLALSQGGDLTFGGWLRLVVSVVVAGLGLWRTRVVLSRLFWPGNDYTIGCIVTAVQVVVLLAGVTAGAGLGLDGIGVAVRTLLTWGL